MSKGGMSKTRRLVLTTACQRSGQQYGVCPPIADATRAQVRVFTSKDLRNIEYSISSPEGIKRLLNFANARREVSKSNLATMPVPTMNAALYEGNNFVGSIGTGSNFVFVGCMNWEGTRAASAAELGEFQDLISAPK
jgi:hypothetical protein